ncbi:reductase with NAD or NADP as acceptor [Phaeodactylum tricornutum CCAP 1055/1]|jgi:nucleoside-diphosphate-sugar epimerase|uniref:Reductase with NAD or NADP as acceptor n=2 Tax=Phaeodactylum tricornutum TaxID=2850 RepID=B7G8M9_PHATC|nr:reductase with NAD or NADP as acceptor [Phaeodactylum tricornutum CCAP 1055/1]EEC45071.1 reductase with NAD or NADP as acceptor [Phaeodactylum tricornutum CCAP 1055/1]|eukprot:XP_002183371.1 reductase with NAD or NADP as acceptor [Phaeodactylum tricornutum CCAP 1055/1]
MFGWKSPGKKKAEPGFATAQGCVALVTGSSGLCGARLVEMLLDRGARTVICFDRAKPSEALEQRFQEAQKKTGGKLIVLAGPDGDLCSDEAVQAAFDAEPKIDVVFHIAALVGPFHEYEMYNEVNYKGTLRILENCKRCKVPKLVYSSSPSTRFTGKDVTGQTEDELPMPDTWLAMYAETKAYGEMAVSKACSDTLRTISVAPHQIYGPHDTLFLSKLLETAGTGRLRIFGQGKNKISVCYVDNYCHGLMCGSDVLDTPNHAALGKFYIITDGEPQLFWAMLNQAVLAMGFTDLYSKFHLPVWFLYIAAYVANVIGFVIKKKLKLNPFNVKMLTIHRYFSIANARRDLLYEPVLPFNKAWPLTIEWFKEHWLPQWEKETGRADSSVVAGRDTKQD